MNKKLLDLLLTAVAIVTFLLALFTIASYFYAVGFFENYPFNQSQSAVTEP